MSNPAEPADPLKLAWEGRGRPDDMPDLDWVVALEEIRLLKARRDRYTDACDWTALEALHAPEHVSVLDGKSMNSASEMIRTIRPLMEGRTIMHASCDSEIVFDTPTSVRGIWAVVDSSVANPSAAGGDDMWKILFGYYYETYEKRNGRWLFTSRRWHCHFGVTSDGPVLATERPKDSRGFAPGLR
jgi:hypothetical protein